MPRWLSVTAGRDRCYRRSFTAAGLRPSTTGLGDGATVHLWLPRRPDPSRPALLLLHGFGALSTWQWAPYLRPLTRAGFDLYVPDLVFFGGSSTPAPARSESYQAQCVMAAMDALGVARFALAGVSYGGFVGYRLAAMYPAAVDRAVLICAGVCLEERDLAAGLLAVSDVAEAASLLLPQRPDKLRQLVNLTFSRPPPLMPNCFIRDYIQVMCTEYVKEKTELLHSLVNGRKLSDLPTITQVSFLQPTLIIWGEEDRVFPLELAFRLKRHLGEKSQLVIVKNAGHAINREKPREVCKLIRNFCVDSSVKVRDRHKVTWSNVIRRFERSRLRRIDSGRPLL
ncbi:uncharacterized protein LOC109721020 isoform X1 [Ananas comosus]|uniref:Uncharacterized protein LOC109721020 isoform X1 n=1 Tax=Ananas comosus TaxID=4615 RepID=A0A6P5G6P9_ANACO|nr:uncharacterized protein LOC109721020 isoform X1 [Ananas comosus]